MKEELCYCGEGWYDPGEYSSCYACYVERRSEYVDCIFCGRWHSHRYATCFQCRTDHREDAGRELRWMILARDQYTCWVCGETGPEMEVDHVKPCRSGGTAHPWNLQALCRPCNREKGDEWWVGSRWDKRRGELLAAYFTTLRQYLSADERVALAEEVWAWRVAHCADPEWPTSLPSMADFRTAKSSPPPTADGDAPAASRRPPSSTASSSNGSAARAGTPASK